jgi:transposase-like protein
MDSHGPEPKRCRYSPQDMAAAVEDVKLKKANAKEAAKSHGIPYTTLRDRLSGIHNGIYGRTTTLSEKEEQEIVDWIEDCAKLGQPLSKEQVMDAATKISNLPTHQGRNFQDSGKFDDMMLLR